MIFRPVLRRLRSGRQFAVLLLSEGLLALICLAWSPVAQLLATVLPRQQGKRVGCRVIRHAFRSYLRCLELIGLYKFDIASLDGLQSLPPVIIAPNHPSLLDALVVLSRHDDTVCVIKASLIDNLFMGAGARLAGYIRNDWFIGTVSLAVEALQGGSHVLLFPEGTRTEHAPIDPIKGGIGVLARRANVAIQTVIIETDSMFLSKGWPWWRVPNMPIQYKVSLGERFDPPHDIQQLPQLLEASFRRQLAAATMTGRTDRTNGTGGNER